MKKYFAFGFLAALAVWLVIAAAPDYRSFAPTQFATNGGWISITNTAVVTNFNDTGTLRAQNVTVTNDINVGLGGGGNINLSSLGQTEVLSIGEGAVGGNQMFQAWQSGTNSFITFGDQLGSSFHFALGGLASPGGGTRFLSIRDNGGVSMPFTLSVTGALTNSALTASTLVSANATKVLASIANASGVLTNDGAGGLGFSTNIAQDVTYNNVTVTNLTVIETNTFHVAKGGHLTVSNTFTLQPVASALLQTTSAGVVTNVASFSGLTFDPAARSLAVDTGASGLAYQPLRFRRTTTILPAGTGGTITIMGDSATLAGGASTVLVNESNAVAVALTTGAAANADGGLSGNGMYRMSRTIDMSARIKPSSLSSNRWFVGFSSAAINTMVTSDTPNGSYAGFSYSQPRADTNFMILLRASAAETAVTLNTGLTANTNLDTMLRVVGSWGTTTNVAFYTNNVLVTNYTVLTSIPTNTVNYSYIIGILTLDAVDKALELGGAEISVNK